MLIWNDYIVTVDKTNMLKMWNLETLDNDPSQDIIVPDGIQTIALIPDTDLMVAFTYTGDIIIWNLVTKMIEKTLIGHTAEITNFKFAKNMLATISRDHTVKAWNLEDGTFKSTYNEGNILLIYKDLIVTSRDVWNPMTGEKKLYNNGREVRYITQHPYKDLIVTSTFFGTIKFWDPKDWWCFKETNFYSKAIYSMVFLNDQLIIGFDNIIKVIDLEKDFAMNDIEIKGSVEMLLATSDNRLVSAFKDGGVVIWR